MTTAQWIIRGTELGLTLREVLRLEVGELLDLIIEKNNDSCEYATLATQEDIEREFGG